jgi:hypothetical protein
LFALAVLAGMISAFLGSILLQRESEPMVLEPDPILQPENQQRLVIGLRRAVTDGDAEFAGWLVARLGER